MDPAADVGAFAVAARRSDGWWWPLCVAHGWPPSRPGIAGLTTCETVAFRLG